MAKIWCLLLAMGGLVLLGPGDHCACLSQELSTGARVRAGLVVPDLLGSISVDAAMGRGSLSWGGGLDVLAGEAWSAEARGALTLHRDWLSLTLAGAWGRRELSMAALATPPPWWAREAYPFLWMDLQAGASVLWTPANAQPIAQMTLAPRVQSLFNAGRAVIAPSIRYDLVLRSDEQELRMAGVVLSSSIEQGDVTGTVSISLEGFFDRVASVRAALHWAPLGVTVTGAGGRTPSGGLAYDVGLLFEWGDLSRLPKAIDESGSTCIGDVCY